MKYLAALLLLLLAGSPLWADCPYCMFYSGDFDPNNPNADGLANENDAFAFGNPYGAATYQNFVVTESAYIPTMFTDNLSSLDPSTGYWEIRSGVSEGNGGTIVASGTGAMRQTPTGRSAFGYSEYKDEVVVSVSLGPGTYWFAVVPNDPGNPGRSFNSNTFGLNRVGTEIDNEQ